MTQTPHIGKKISRIRELRGMKQEVLAEALGISQQAISKIEQSETIEDSTLERISKALGVNTTVIKNFTDENALFNIQNNYEGSHTSGPNYQYNFNPVDKWMATLEENKTLYERLLQSEKEKVALLQKMLESKG